MASCNPASIGTSTCRLRSPAPSHDSHYLSCQSTRIFINLPLRIDIADRRLDDPRPTHGTHSDVEQIVVYMPSLGFFLKALLFLFAHATSQDESAIFQFKQCVSYSSWLPLPSLLSGLLRHQRCFRTRSSQLRARRHYLLFWHRMIRTKLLRHLYPLTNPLPLSKFMPIIQNLLFRP